MNYEQELEKSLKELRRITGLSIQIEEDAEINPEETVRQLRALSTAYKEKNNKNFIIRRWMTGDISESEFYDIAKKLHIAVEEKRYLYLIKTDEKSSKEVEMILKNLFPGNSNMWIIPLNESEIVLLQSFYRKEPDPKMTAYEIANTISAEIFVQIKVAYSELFEHIKELQNAYRQACFSMEVGEMFDVEQYVYGHGELGIGRILYDVPKNLCADYMKEQMSDQFMTVSSAVFESDMLNTVNCFLDNNLNIAETARQLHIHRNTLLYRMEQIQKETGLDIRQFNDAMTYKISSLILLKYSTEELKNE